MTTTRHGTHHGRSAVSIVGAGRPADLASVAPLVVRTAPDVDAEGSRRRSALAAWSVIGQSGDGDAVRLVRLLGAERALALVRSTNALGDLRSAIHHADAVDPSDELALLDGLPAALERWHDRLDPDLTIAACRAAAVLGVHLLTPLDAGWPAGLDDLDVHAPFVLWVRGDPLALSRARGAIALVGARASSGYGTATATELGAGTAEAGLVVVSGGAYGIDGAAHRGALAVERPTVAVMAGGPDRLYPTGHQDLLHRIAATGAVVSELPCGQAPTRWRFLSRNRIIAALGDATVVVEAGQRSGAINTAGHAAQLGRPLGAVPGPVTSGSSAGCHRLIREYGAILVRDADDAVELATPGFDPEPLFELADDDAA